MRKLNSILVMGLMIGTLFVLSSAAGEGRATTAHAPIVITSDAGFTSANGVTAGDGSAASPFIIENYEITVSGAGTSGINISSATKSFIIRGCTVSASDSALGISLWSCNPGKIETNTVTGGLIGITVQNSNGCTVSANTVGTCPWGIAAQNSDSTTLKDNKVSDVTTSGIAVQNSNSCTVTGNTVARAGDGIVVQNSNTNTVDANIVHNSTITQGQSTGSGILVQNANQNTITNNEVRDCAGLATACQNAAGNTYHHNKFKSNAAGAKQASESNGVNTWNAAAAGNYWSDLQGPDANSDGVVDVPYVLVSATSGKDNFPLVNPAWATGTPPGAPQNLAANSTEGKVTLTWAAPAVEGSSAVNAYKVYRGTTSGSLSLLATLGNVLAYSDSAVTNGAVYYYQVSAANGAGEGARTSEVQGTPRSTPRPDLSVEDVSCSKLIPTDGNTVTLTIKVKNVGTADVAAGTITRVTVDGTTLKDITMAAIPAGTTVNVTTTWKAVKSTHTIKAQADSPNTLTEISETNNEGSTTVVVSPKITPPKGFIPGFEAVLLVAALAVGLLALGRRK
jgi:parallel beta-helix repeat protein